MDQRTKFLWKERIVGSRKIGNIGWACITFLGSFSFLSVGFSSFLGTNLIPFLNSKDIAFLPQGLVMCFYGFMGCILSLYLCLILLWNIGEGYNEFDKQSGELKFFRWGFPGKNRRIQMIYPIQNIEGLRLELKEGINPRRTLYLKLSTFGLQNSPSSLASTQKGEIILPLTQIGQPLTLVEIEEKAADLASFLQVSIENIR